MRADVKKLTRELDAFARKQIPFATAQALTATARKVQEAETRAMGEMFKSASPFTMKSVRVIPARKNNLQATVFVMDRAAKYLKPYEAGGVHQLNSRALLNPKDIKLNSYGQLPRATLAKLKARPDIFIGPVHTNKGTINGVWQRSTEKPVRSASGKRLRKANTSGHLKLLIRFGDALPVRQKWDYAGIAAKTVAAVFPAEMRKALDKAIATAR